MGASGTAAQQVLCAFTSLRAAFAQVVAQMPPVGDLDCVGQGAADGLGVGG
jgi:hypothetical protein